MTTIGILSDTHINQCTEPFIDQVQRAFSTCDLIIHAGDLTDISILSAFEGKRVHAVHGNMCNGSAYHKLPEHKKITCDGYQIGICHGAGPRHNIEERVWQLFPDADCIVYGHSHIPVCEWHGQVLFINPGSFQTSGPFGAPASYALLETTKKGIRATLKQLQWKQ